MNQSTQYLLVDYSLFMSYLMHLSKNVHVRFDRIWRVRPLERLTNIYHGFSPKRGLSHTLFLILSLLMLSRTLSETFSFSSKLHYYLFSLCVDTPLSSNFLFNLSFRGSLSRYSQ